MGQEFVIPVDRLLRAEYIKYGPIRLKLPNNSYPQTLFHGKMRAFQANWYISRPWLEYNKYNDSALCFPCRVFGSALNKYDRTFVEDGFRQWPHVLEKNRGFDKHSKSENHSMCMEKWTSYLHETPVDVLISEYMKKALSLANKERQSRKDIVYLLIDVVITLAQLNLPFRGHNEGEVSANKGVFKGIVELISRYHPPLMIHLQKGQANPKGYPSYLSPTSQNEMIQYSAEILREDIIENIQIAHFFSICLDTTPDIAKKDQLSIVVRYVNINGEIIESLLDLIEVANCTAVGLVTTIVEVFSKHGLLIESLRGQGYDGCATMAGRYNGVQNLIKVKNPKAYFVHCYAHRLNLVIIDTCKHNVITRNFFGIMQKLYAFIEGSTKRHGLFKDIQMKCYASQGEGKKIGTLKSLSDTRWSSRAEACQVLLENISVLLKVLDSIIYDGKYDSGIASDAFSLSKCIDFQFCLCLVTFTDILKLCNIISKYLQNEVLNISSASLHIESLISTLQGYTTEAYFDQLLYLQAEKIAENIGVTYSEPRHRKVPTRLDDSEHHVPIVLTGKDRMKAQFFNDVIELIKEALQSRFSHETMPLLKSIECLNPPKPETIQDLRVLSSYYIGDFDADFIEYEYKLLAKSIELSNIGKIGIHKLYLDMVKEGIAKLYPNLNILYMLILTLPVTSSAFERSFSTLKLIKTRLRSTMCENRLSNLLLLSVESNRMKSIPETFEKIHERFWNTPRK